MGNTAWKKRLKNLSNYKENREAEAPEFENVPDGRYDARITGGELKLSKNKEEMIMLSTVVIGDSEEADRTVNVFIMLEGAGSPGGFSTLKKLGYEIPEESEDLADLIEDLIGSEKEVVIKVKGGFGNVEGLLDEEAHVASETEEASEEEEENVDVIDVGDDVTFTFKDEEKEGTVTEILEKDGKAKIKSGGKIYTIAAEKISKAAVEEEEASEEEEVEEEPEEEPTKKVTKKKPAPAAKKVTKKKK